MLGKKTQHNAGYPPAVKFSERLAQVLREKKIDQKQLASEIGVTSKAVSAYVRGKSYPSLEKFVKIVKALGVSADYLLGFSDEPRIVKVERDDGPFADEILTIRKAYGHMSLRERRVVMQLIKGLVGEMESDGNS